MLQVQFLLDRFPAIKPAQVIVRDSRHYPDQLQSALQAVGKDGFDIVLDAVAGEFFQPSYQAMTRGGRHIVFGAANWTPTGIIVFHTVARLRLFGLQQVVQSMLAAIGQQQQVLQITSAVRMIL